MNIDELIQDLKNPDSLKRMEAAEELGRSRENQAIQPLISSLNDTDAEVRYAVVKSLGQFEDDSITRAVMNSLKDPAWYVRAQAGVILENNIAENSQSILEFLFQNDPHKLSKLCVAFSLVTLEKDNEKTYLKFILDLLNDDDLNVRIHAATILGDLGDSSVVDTIMKSFESQNLSVKQAMIHTLSHYYSAEVEKWLSAILNEDNVELKSSVIQAYEMFASDFAVSQLILSLSDENPYIRSCAAIALGNTNNESAIQPLIERLKDPDHNVVYYSKKALGKIGI
ncbi:MAG TPA: HEAT repeat domain-containing protein [Spirochaetes bacterium]|nr:HEAT repeat domain-containing protein [Spirochaetota bacterium]